MKKLLLLLTWMMIGILKLSSQCSIENMTVEIADCNGDDVVMVTIDFNYDEVSDSFSVSGNGNQYGVYAYSNLPVDLGNFPADCDTEYEFVVRDRQDENCSKAIDAGKICCEDACEIEIIDFEAGRCSDDGITVTFDLNRSGTQDVGFDVYSGNDFVGFYTYEQLPLRIEGLPSSGTATEKITVCENDQPDCCDTMIFESTCGCGIFEIDVDVVECDADDMTFYARIDFEPQMTSDSFLLGGNNTTYGTYAYTDLPILVGPLGFSETIEYEFLIIDRASSVCFNFYDVGLVPSCDEAPCDIDDVTISFPEDCTPNGIIYGSLEFNYSGNVADSFTVRGNGINYGTFPYGSDSYRIGPIPGDCKTYLEFEVRDLSDDGCFDATELEEPLCCESNCTIQNLQADIDECVEDGVFYVDLTFESEGMTSDSFYIKGNGNQYGTFPYGESKYRIGPLQGDCETIYEFVVQDSENPDCQADIALEEKVCCEQSCFLEEIGLGYNCDDRKLTIEVVTSNSQVIDSAIIVINNEPVDTISKEDFPYFYTFEETPAYILVEVMSTRDAFCIIEKDIEPECIEDCEIGNLDIQFLECNEEDKPYFKLNFEHNRKGDDVFKVEVDETIIGFYPYSALPLDIGPIQQPEEEYFIVVRDSVINSCVNRLMVEPVTCSSSTGELDEYGISINISPGNIFINNDGSLDANLQVISVTGISMFQGKLGTGVQINTHSWQQGIYITRFRLGAEIMVSKVFIY